MSCQWQFCSGSSCWRKSAEDGPNILLLLLLLLPAVESVQSVAIGRGWFFCGDDENVKVCSQVEAICFFFLFLLRVLLLWRPGISFSLSAVWTDWTDVTTGLLPLPLLFLFSQSVLRIVVVFKTKVELAFCPAPSTDSNYCCFCWWWWWWQCRWPICPRRWWQVCAQVRQCSLRYSLFPSIDELLFWRSSWWYGSSQIRGAQQKAVQRRENDQQIKRAKKTNRLLFAFLTLFLSFFLCVWMLLL